MKTHRRSILAAALALPAPALAQGFPSRPIRLVCPFAAGGSADASARQLAEPLSAALGQPVVVENRPGGGATLGAQLVARAAPDGHTLLYGTPGPQSVNPHLMRSVPYDPVRDFAPVSGYKRAPNLLAVHPSLPAQDLAQLIALAKARPGTLTFASSGVGSSSHLAGEMLKFLGGVDITHVPYRGTGPAMTDLLSGTVAMALDTLSILLPPARAGSLRALGVTTPQRSRLVPELPALAETLPGFDAAPFNYIAATGGTPPAIVARLNQAIVGILNEPAYRARMEALGEEATPSSPEELAETIARESARWKQVIEAAGIRVE
ncbi:tripartite tricarboxylate transporter substrate binding protein [Roseomonas sp. PWR1]|uniref:Tripartite tricarboxylate transporter substrate binding protein n=1 Tax=Roseomonas nitratireducens TaxID=2820810 RepID=A0ABS4ARM1_9PROT|nr:tripartite tricarboxylate transporter substrate binding protein [Neoroseomonas nitratireducens]MBP0464014.1 tripartite tricarboxylate transporter substrate binding protein [Neoroseomonas nitratireducens]